ncbi:MAG: glycosyltransferase family 4 protein [Myxococcota bacterium]
MKVVLVGDYPPPPGGVAVHVRQLFDYLREKGADVKVLDVGKGGHEGDGVYSARTPKTLVAQLSRLASSGHLVHLHTSGNNSMAWMLAAVVSVCPAPVGRVLTLHSGLFPGFVERSLGRRLLVRLAAEAYGRVVAVSPPIAEALVKLGVPAERVRMHPAFLASQVRPGKPPAGFDEVRRRRSPLLAMAHHPSPVYGRALMFRALRRSLQMFPDLGLAVFGPGTRHRAFQEAARAERVEGVLEDFGELPHDQALALLRGCDLFVRPTLVDGDAVSVREALALGVPCVASNVVARPAGVTTFRAGDEAALVEALGTALCRRPPPSAGPDAGPFLFHLYEELL